MVDRRTVLGAAGGIAALSSLPGVQAQTTSSITYGETSSGEITESNQTDSRYPNYHTQPYAFEGDSGDEVKIVLDMPDADEWIRIVSPSGDTIFDNSTANTQITLDQSGLYVIYPQSYPENVPGHYTLTIDLVDGNANSENEDEAEEDEGDTTDEEQEDFDVTPDPAYIVETRALAACSTRAIIEAKIDSDSSAAFSDYEEVGALEFRVNSDMEITRVIEAPDPSGNIFQTTGSLLLSTGSLASGPLGAILTVADLALSGAELASDLMSPEGNTSATSLVVTGDSSTWGTPDSEFLNGTVNLIIEVESDTPADEIVSDLAGGSVENPWGTAFSFGYRGQPQQDPSETQIDEQYYSAEVKGDIFEPDAFDC